MTFIQTFRRTLARSLRWFKRWVGWPESHLHAGRSEESGESRDRDK
jgi:hypothetical protein